MPDYTLNRTGADIDAIGGSLAASSSLSTIAPNTYVDLCKITLTPGTWIIAAQGRFQLPTANRSMILSLSTISGVSQPAGVGGFAQIQNGANGFNSMNVVRMWSVTENTDMYLVGWQNGDTEANILSGQCYMRAIRIR